MATLEEVAVALKKAHAAGDVESANKLANAYRQMQSQSTVENTNGNYLDRTIKNTPKSAENFISGIANSLIHPIDTTQALVNIANGAVQNILPESINSLMPDSTRGNKELANLVANDFSNTFGSIENFNESFANDPINVLSKLSLVTSLPSLYLNAGSMAAKLANAPKTSTKFAKQANYISKASNLINPINIASEIIKYGVKVPASIIQAPSGILTGLGYDKLGQYTKDAFEGKKGTLDAIRGNTKVEELIPRFQTALESIKTKMNEDYVKNIVPISKDKTVLSMDDILSKLKETGEMTYRKMPGGNFYKGKDAVLTQKNISNVINDFIKKSQGKPNVMDLDSLKQKIYDVGMKPNKPGTLEYKIGSNIYHSIKKTIENQASDYANVMDNFHKMQEEIQNIQQITSIKPGSNNVASINKLHMLANSKPNKASGSKIRMLDEIKKYDENLLNDLSGISGHDWAGPLTKGFGGLGVVGNLLSSGGHIPHAALGIMTTSPRIAAETAYKVGQGKKLLINPVSLSTKKVIEKLSLIESLKKEMEK